MQGTVALEVPLGDATRRVLLLNYKDAAQLRWQVRLRQVANCVCDFATVMLSRESQTYGHT